MRCLRPVCALALALTACSGGERLLDAGPSRPPLDAGVVDAGPADSGPADVDAGPEPLVVTALAEVTDDAGLRSTRYRLQRGDAAAGYAQWYPPATDGGVAPVVVLTQPYDGIDWTGEAVDERWAARGPGLYPDEDGPGFDANTSSSIGYDPMTLEEAGDSTFLWRYHGFGVLLLFGRFYAGGDVQNDIDDMTMGLEFLASQPDVDPGRVGIMGGSWGGFEALYGAAYAPAELKPAVGVALYPLSDFEAERRFITEVLPGRYQQPASREASATFFEPYLRRLDATVARNSGFVGLRAEDLVARIDAPFLIVHEDWDTLVSIEQSQRLVSLAPDRFLPLWLLHDGPPEPWDQALTSHGQLLNDFASLGVYPFVFAHLLTHLGAQQQPLVVPWDAPSFRALLELMHRRHREGVDMAFLAAQLSLLCDPRVSTFDVSNQAMVPGGQTVAAELSVVWGVELGAEAACQDLAQGRLPAP